MTDLVRPVPGQSLLDSDGAGTTSTELIDAAFDVIETNEDALLVRTSPHIVTTDQYSDLPEVVFSDGTSLTGFHVTRPDDLELTPTLQTVSGHTAVQGYIKSQTGDTTAALYVNLTEIGYPTGLDVIPGSTITIDVCLSQAAGGETVSQAYLRFAATIADGADMTGSLVSTTYATGETAAFLIGSWYTIRVPVGALTNIKSIGIKKVLSTGSNAQRARWNLDNVRKHEVTPFDQAYNAQAAVAVMVPPSYPSVTEQLPFMPEALKSIVDFRPDHAWISGMGGFKNIREWGLDETGTTDVRAELQDVLDSLSPGDVLLFPPGAAFRCDDGLWVRVPGVTIDGQGAALMQGFPDALYNGIDKIATSTDRRLRIHAPGCTIKNLRVFGASITPTPGNTMTLAGGATAVLTTALLDGINESASWTNVPGRDWTGECRQTFIVSSTNNVTNDCVITITDDDGAVLATDTFTPTVGTPTARTVTFTPKNLFCGSTAKVTKATGTSNGITVTRLDTYNNCLTVWTGTAWEFCHGIVANYSNTTFENIVSEAVQGDGFYINNSLPKDLTNVQVKGLFVRGCGRQGIAPCGGSNHVLEDCYVLYAARNGVDFEPENAESTAVDGVTIRNMVVWRNAGLRGFSSGAGGIGWARNRNIKVDGLYVNTLGTAMGGGFKDSRFTNLELRAPTAVNVNAAIQGGNVTWDNVRIDGRIDVGDATILTGEDENDVIYPAGGLTLRNILFQRPLLGESYVKFVEPQTPGTHFEGLRIADKVTLDTTYGVSAFEMRSDTTYTDIDLVPHRTTLPNSYPGVAIGQPWFPGGLDLGGKGIRRAAFLSGSTVRGNNLGRFQESVTAAATSKTVVFPPKTYPNVFTIALSNATGGTLTPLTAYHYRFAARNRNGGPVLATANQSITTSGTGTAVNMLIDGMFDVPTGIQIEGITIYRGPASGNYTTRYDIIPTGDMPFMGGTGTGLGKRMPIQDKGTTVLPWGNNFYGGYTFPYTSTLGAFTPVDESGWEVDTNYAVFIETSWHTTHRVTARRRDGFDVEFGVPAPTGTNTMSWMIARF